MKNIDLKKVFTEKHGITIIFIIYLLQEVLRVYKSNEFFFVENIFNIVMLIYIFSFILSLVFIKNSKILLLILVFFLDIPFYLKVQIQGLINIYFGSYTLIVNHLITLIV